MKAETAMITINGKATMKVLLIPESDKELEFVKEALNKADDYKLSAQLDKAT